jgi:tetratricopeptide (TPR) repeat protein/transcriptional regulator with XRE-family HTH domain
MLLAELLRRLRLAAVLTQAELAAAAGISERTVSDLERGKTLTTQLNTARRLADALRLTGAARARFIKVATGQSADSGTEAEPHGTEAEQQGLAAATRTLPRDVASFTGRQAELKELRSAADDAADPDGVVQVCVIHGMPGVGKTTAAVHFAREVAGRFPDGQLLVRLYGHAPGYRPTEPADALSALLLAAGVPRMLIPQGLEARAELWRDRSASRRFILLLDDACGVEQVLPLLPGGGGTLVLVTSRQRFTELPDTMDVPVDIMHPAEAAALFVRLAGRRELEPGNTDVARVVQWCGRLPLAISLVAGQLKQRKAWTITDLADVLARDGSRLVAGQRRVAAAFDLSYQNLAPDLQRLFRRLGLHPGSDVDAYAAAALDASDLASTQQRLSALFDCHLIDEPDRGRFRFHDLIRAHARSLAEAEPAAEREAAERRLLDYYLHMARAAYAYLGRRTLTGMPDTGMPDSEGTPPAHARNLSTWQEANAWMDADYLNVHAAAELAERHGYYGHAIAIPAFLDAYLIRHGHWNQALDLHRLALAAAHEAGDQHSVARSLGEIGSIRYQMVQMDEATGYLNRALSLYRDLGDQLGTAHTLRRLGIAGLATGKYAAAAEDLAAALAIYQHEGDSRGEAETICNLGVMQYETGDNLSAVASQTKALDMYVALGDVIGQANALCFLGEVQTATGHHTEAIANITQAQPLYHEIGDDWGAAGARYYLGAARRAAGLYQLADHDLRRALDMYVAIGDQYDEAGVLNQIGMLRTATGQFTDAAASLDRALMLYDRAGSRNGEAEVRNSLGELALASRWRTASAAEALGHLERALSISAELGIQREEARAREGISQFRLQVGERDQAIDALRLAHAIYQRIESPAADRVKALLDRLGA